MKRSDAEKLLLAGFSNEVDRIIEGVFLQGGKISVVIGKETKVTVSDTTSKIIAKMLEELKEGRA